MPRAFWRHPETNRPVRDPSELDPFVPPAIVHGMETKEREDTRHTGLNITITTLLGCPRRFFTERCLDVGINPVDVWGMQHGTWMHEHLGSNMPGDEWVTEEHEHEACVVEGKLFGLELSGLLDCYRRDLTELIDWKTTSNISVRYKKKDGDKADAHNSAQVNMQRILLGQKLGQDTSGMVMRLWHIGSKSMHRQTAPFMTEEDIGNVRPALGKKYKVRDIAKMLAEGKAAIEAGEDPKDVIAGLPMVGEDMWKNKYGQNACSSYCSVREECYGCQAKAFEGGVMGI